MYLQHIIVDGTNVEFKFSDGEIVTGIICNSVCFVSLNYKFNNYIFDKLGLKKYEFIKSVVGYKPGVGSWPEVKSKKDLDKVLNALRKYNNPNYYHENSHMSMEKAMSLMIDSQAKKSNNIISVRKKSKTKLNFKL